MSVTKVPNELLSDPHIGVGITDTATSAKLAVSNSGIDVTGEVQASSFVMDDSNNTDRWELLRDGNDFTIYNDYPSQSERFRITSGGSVGIGTNPLQKLHIDTGASGLPAIRLSHTNTGADNFDITAGTPGVSNSGFTIRDVDAAANRLTIDSAGRVTMPFQPAFSAYDGAANNSSSINTVQFTTTTVNVGGSYNTSTYRFTAPVSGNYSFSYGWMANFDEPQRSAFYINGIQKAGQNYSDNTTHDRINGAGIFYLASGDYIEVKNNINSSSTEGYTHADYRYFTGHLIG
jgi:hypothetical protein